MRARVLDGSECGHSLPQIAQDLPRLILASIVDHHDLVTDVIETQLEVQVLHGRRDATLLVQGRDDNAQLGQRGQRGIRDGRFRHGYPWPEISSHSGCIWAWARMSSRMSSVVRLGAQCQMSR